jgi:hypothetical protein
MRRNGRARRPLPPALVLGGLLVLLSIPLVVAVIALRTPHWYPYADSAAVELRLRDVWSSHIPLVGAIGRFGDKSTLASHPGPLGFYALWPVYELAGASAWAMTVASVSVHVAAMATALWIAFRRGGVHVMLGMGALLAVLVHGYGPSLLADAWNPFVPLLWWLVFLLAVWSVTCDDLAMLPVAVFAGSLCAQCHVSYLGSTVALGVFALGWAAVRAQRGRGASMRALGRWALVAAVVGVLVWLPPVVEELRGSPGNLSEIWGSFTNPSTSPIGLGSGLEIFLKSLDPWTILTHGLGHEKIEFASASFFPGLLLVVVWAGSALAAWRLGNRALRQLHVVLAAALVLAVLSCSRVVGDRLSYLFFWVWGLSALMVFAIAWTAFALVKQRRSAGSVVRLVSTVIAVLLAVVLIMGAFTTGAATGAQIDDSRLSHELGELVGPTVTALRSGRVAGHGRDGRYLVTWVDPLNFGLQGFGLMNELERAGFQVGTRDFYRAAVTPHRVLEPADAIGGVHLAIGADIARWDAKPAARRVAYYEPRSRRQQAEYERLRQRVIGDLLTAGMKKSVPFVDDNLVTLLYFGAGLDPATRARMKRMIDLGLDLAVFVAPAEVADH